MSAHIKEAPNLVNNSNLKHKKKLKQVRINEKSRLPGTLSSYILDIIFMFDLILLVVNTQRHNFI